MGSIVWLVAGVAFILAELIVLNSALLLLGLAALITAGVALGDFPLWVDIVVFASSSIIGLALLRPVLRRYVDRKEIRHEFSAKELEGSPAVVVDPITTHLHHSGTVSIGGELWSARAAQPGDQYQEGEHVHVVEIDGTTAVVWKGLM